MPKGDREIGKADPEDGTTPIANLLLEALIIANLTSKERAAILFLIRRTYGWLINGKRLKEDAIDLTTWAKILQVKDNTRASKILSTLEDKGAIKRELIGPGKGYIYTINTTVANWNNCLNQQLLSEMATLALPKRTRVVLSQKTTPSATKLASEKEKIKEILNKENISTDKKAEKIWGKALTELRNQVNKANFDTWLKDTVGLRYAEGVFVIGVPGAYVADNIQHNQKSLIEKTLAALLEGPVSIEFEILDRERALVESSNAQ